MVKRAGLWPEEKALVGELAFHSGVSDRALALLLVRLYQ